MKCVRRKKKRERGNLIISIDSPRFLLSGFELYFIVQQQQQQRVVDFTYNFFFVFLLSAGLLAQFSVNGPSHGLVVRVNVGAGLTPSESRLSPGSYIHFSV